MAAPHLLRPDFNAFLVGRSPLLPIAVAKNILDADDPFSLAIDLFCGNVDARVALFLAAPDFYNELIRASASGAGPSRKAAIRAALYLLRMSSRPTPYGMFATVGEIVPSDSTDLSLSSTVIRRTLPDMAWIDDIVKRCEEDPSLRLKLRAFEADGVVESDDRVYIGDTRHPEDAETEHSGRASASVKRLPVVAQVLRSLRDGAKLSDIADVVVRDFDADLQDAEKLIDDLWLAGTMFTELRPSPFEDPNKHLAEHLPDSSAELKGQLRDVSALIESADHSAGSVSKYRRALKAMREVAPKHAAFYTIAGRSYEGTICQNVLNDAASLASILSYSTFRQSLKEYRLAFLERYGFYERRVPLLELVNPDIGLGPPPSPETSGDRGLREDVAQRRLALAATCLARGEHEMDLADLTQSEFEAILGEAPQRDELHSSIEMSFYVCARSSDDIDAGRYTIVHGGISGTGGGARTVGRFLPALGEDAAARAQSRSLEEEDNDDLVAELVYMPRGRGANVVLRPPSTDYRIELNLRTTDQRRIDLRDIDVFVENDRFVLICRSLGRRIRIRETHMFRSSAIATGAARFLAALRNDGMRTPGPFNWGAAGNLPRLPRLRYGKLIVSPEAWCIPKHVFDGHDKSVTSAKLRAWWETWSIPKYVLLRQYDRLLPMSIHDDHRMEMFLDAIRDLSGDIVVQEMLPDFDDHWVASAHGSHVCELVASLTPAPPPAKAAAAHRPLLAPLPSNGTKRLADDEWVYMKLYIGYAQMEPLVRGEIADFVEETRADGLSDGWFFVRYSDTRPHLRLRMKVAPGREYGELWNRARAFAQRLLQQKSIARYAFEPYEREIERYGGAETFGSVERMFTFDSELALSILRTTKANSDERHEAALVSFDRILGVLLDEGEHSAFAKTISQSPRKLSQAERKIVKRAAAAIVEARASGADAEALAAAGALRAAQDRETLTYSIRSIAATMLHMHFNRCGIMNEAETSMHALLWSIYVQIEQRKAATARVAVC